MGFFFVAGWESSARAITENHQWSKTMKKEKCFCGCESFYISKEEHYWLITCQSCKCERRITTPGVGVDNYSVSIPFVEQKVEDK